MKRTFLAACLIMVSAAASAQTPYDLRGIRLGMTLSEFRVYPFPDTEKRAQNQVICTPDRDVRKGMLLGGSDLDPPPTFAKIGVIICRYYTRMSSGLIMSGFDFAGTGFKVVTFLFSPEESGNQPRLFNITVRMPNALFESVVAAFTAKYGEATGSTASTVQNRMGASFPQAKLDWSNKVSSISIERVAGDISTMAVNYFHNPLTADVNRRTDEIFKAGAKKL
jgi:hypothetical protein